MACTGSSQPSLLSFLVKAAATTVELIGFDTEASWNTVSGSIVLSLASLSRSARRRPKPSWKRVLPSYTTANAMPGTSLCFQ
ncbi:MAG TPA: hypothetical protein VFP34_05960 [Microlunatus sp.]|nr:hypothetical protein [Microlunatus sp.]